MKRHLKTYFNRATGGGFWIERASDDSQLHNLIAKLAPKPVSVPMIRIGNRGDGGYVVPDDLAGIKAVISPGVSTEVGFDLAMAARGVDVYMADASVQGPPVKHDRFHFTKRFLDVLDDETNIRLDTLCSTIAASIGGDRLLQMDIEGAEYRVLLDTSEATLRSFRIIIVEFHFLESLYSNFGLGLIKATFDKLLNTHDVVHIHPNNVAPAIKRGDLSIPPVMEFTFYRKDRITSYEGQLKFPHPLDADNIPGKPTVVLPRCWITP